MSEAAAIDAVIHANDIRGRVPEQFNEETAAQLGRAFAAYFKEVAPQTARVLVGRDMRSGGRTLAEAFSDAVLSAGLDVVDLGLTSTDMLYFASGRFASPGVVFTASHNPSEYNGIKACLPGAAPIGAGGGLARVRDLALQGGGEPFGALHSGRARGRRRQADVLEEFAAHVRSFVNAERLVGLRVVADVANGMGALVVPAVFGSLGVELEVLYGELDGNFPNHPADPLVEANLAPLRSRMRETGADVGLAFDGDADRVFFVDEQASPLSGSVVGALLAVSVLQRKPGSLVLHNAVCSRAVGEVVREHGGKVMPTRVGHTLIKGAMASTGAAFACEHSGHYYFSDNYRSDSGVLAALVLLEVVGSERLALSRLRQPCERYAASGEINFAAANPAAAVTALSKFYSGCPQSRLDGLSVDCGDWWFNIRMSNTEPLLRLNLEARDPQECSKRTEELSALIRRAQSGLPLGAESGAAKRR